MADTSYASLPPPLGGDENRGWQFLSVTWVLSSVVVVLLVARFFTRICVIKKVGPDDYWIFLGVVSTMHYRSLLYSENDEA